VLVVSYAFSFTPQKARSSRPVRHRDADRARCLRRPGEPAPDFSEPARIPLDTPEIQKIAAAMKAHLVTDEAGTLRVHGEEVTRLKNTAAEWWNRFTGWSRSPRSKVVWGSRLRGPAQCFNRGDGRFDAARICDAGNAVG
jgi:hypothetical protein